MNKTKNANDERAANYARLMLMEHMDAHGGCFVIGKTVGIFLNFGDTERDSEMQNAVRNTLQDKLKIEVIGFGQSGLPHGWRAEDKNYSWAMILDAANNDADLQEHLVEAVFEAVRTVKFRDYPRYQFKLIR